MEGGKLALGKRALKVRTRSVDGIDKRESAHGPAGGGTMSITPISAAGLGQYVLQASNSAPLKQALQSLQTSLASGDLSGSQSAFQTLQTLYQNSATAGGTNLSSSSQLSTDLTALGTALTSGDLSTAQSAFATLQSDLKTSPSPSQNRHSSFSPLHRGHRTFLYWLRSTSFAAWRGISPSA